MINPDDQAARTAVEGDFDKIVLVGRAWYGRNALARVQTVTRGVITMAETDAVVRE